jgi:hypothetical protein
MWTPPPGMLRPLGVGERIDASFKIWGRNFLSMAKAMLVIAIPAGIVQALIEASTTTTTSTTNVGSSSFAVSSTSSSTFLGGSFLSLLIGVVVAALAITTMFRIVADACLGQPVDWRQALRAGLSRMLSAIWISILIGFVFAVVVLAVVLVVVIPAAAGNHAVGVLAGIVIGLAGMVFLLWFYICAHLATPLLMLENARGRKAITRAIRLVRGSWWSVFGTVLLMGLIVSVGGLVVGILFLVLLLAAHGDTTATIAINFLLRTVSLVIFTPLSASIAVILAIDMRVRKEGFDIQHLAATLGTSAQPPPGSFIHVPYGPPGAPGPGHPGAGGPYPPPPGGQAGWGQPPPGYRPPIEPGQVLHSQPQPEPPPPPPFVMGGSDPPSVPPSVPPPGHPPPPAPPLPPFTSSQPASGSPFAGLPPPPTPQPPPPAAGPAAVPSLPLLAVPEPAPADEPRSSIPSANDDAAPAAPPEPPPVDSPSASGDEEAPPADDPPPGPAPT